MKTRIILSLFASAFAFTVAGEASAKGACVYVKNETFQCSDNVSSTSSCAKKAPGGLGEFHDGTNCKQIGHGVTWGIASPPQPPAKASFQGVAMSAPADVPPIPSPLQKKAAKSLRF
jgi:hypothetical protein